jgi:hypothetical protein
MDMETFPAHSILAFHGRYWQQNNQPVPIYIAIFSQWRGRRNDSF